MAHQVVPIGDDLAPAAAHAVARGFRDNEIWVWLLRRDRWLRQVLPRHYRAMIRRVFVPRGGAWTTTDALGAALWFPPGTQEMSWREQLTELVTLMPQGLTCLGRAARWDQLIHSHRPREPHWYLNTLSVSPDAQRSGVGSALIEPGLERADREGVGAYLETQRPANIPFYRRFGFELTDEISLHDSPPVWLMWRDPRA